MATILQFRRRMDDADRAGTGPDVAAERRPLSTGRVAGEIVLFTGVRYERMPDMASIPDLADRPDMPRMATGQPDDTLGSDTLGGDGFALFATFDGGIDRHLLTD